jgi:hypothetical protein
MHLFLIKQSDRTEEKKAFLALLVMGNELTFNDLRRIIAERKEKWKQKPSIMIQTIFGKVKR